MILQRLGLSFWLKIIIEQLYMHVVLYNEPTFPNYWYNHVTQLYANILKSSDIGLTMDRLLYGDAWGKNKLVETLQQKIDDPGKYIHILNPIHYCTFLANRKKKRVLEKIYEFLLKVDYIILWQEILTDDFRVIGYGDRLYNRDFSLFFFRNAKHIWSSNLISLNILKKHDIDHCSYNIITGYSAINRIIPFDTNSNKSIDIFIYGTLNKKYTYRQNMIDCIVKGNQYGYNIVIREAYGDKLDQYLKASKIVVHVPSYEGLEHMPWPKITYLQARKVMFIVEENAELYQANLEDIIVSYNGVDDLYMKVGMYINDSYKVIERNYGYIKGKMDMDKEIPKKIENQKA